MAAMNSGTLHIAQLSPQEKNPTLLSITYILLRFFFYALVGREDEKGASGLCYDAILVTVR